MARHINEDENPVGRKFLPPTPVDVILRAERALLLARGMQAFEEVQDSRLELSTVTYNAALGACEVGSCWEKALRLYAQMQASRRARPDALTRKAVVSVCRVAKRLEMATEVLEQMLSEDAVARTAVSDNHHYEFWSKQTSAHRVRSTSPPCLAPTDRAADGGRESVHR